ncbi:hypothetical protein [Vulcanisaeta sp. JCM 16159]|uniref:hypothetical protein n=1 Tax=Vulcanisaeta sp. JCM 16159 TaxID=1295371 RepID=UPI0006D0E880|nr:hypothetical protein [Vulcanisaeta sp. JCM 16159]
MGQCLLAPSIVRQASLSNVPYVKVSSINVTSVGVFVKLTIIKQGSLSFTPLGGWVEVVDTGQSANVSGGLLAVLPLTPQYVGLNSVGVKGIIYGYLNGSTAYIAFFDIVPIHVVNSIGIINFTYSNCLLTVYLNASLVVPAVINYAINVSLFAAYTHTYVFSTVNQPFNISLIIPPGNHVIKLEIPIKPTNEGYTYVYGCGIEPGTYYTLYMPMEITYVYPMGNTTQFTIFIKMAKGG